MKRKELKLFDVKAAEDKCRGTTGGILVSVTHNGYQWTSISLRNKGEIKKVIGTLQLALNSNLKE